MKEDCYWNFSKGERYAALIFAIATIIAILCMRLPANDDSDNTLTEQYSEEIKRFEEKAVLRDSVKDTPKQKVKRKTSRPKNTEQRFTPKIRENRN